MLPCNLLGCMSNGQSSLLRQVARGPAPALLGAPIASATCTAVPPPQAGSWRARCARPPIPTQEWYGSAPCWCPSTRCPARCARQSSRLLPRVGLALAAEGMQMQRPRPTFSRACPVARLALIAASPPPHPSQVPPLWLICAPEGGSSSEGGSEDGQGTAFGSFDRPAGAAADKRSPTPDLPYGPLVSGSAAAPAAASREAQQAAAQPPAASGSNGIEASAASAGAPQAASAGTAGGKGMALPPKALMLAALHARSDSFAFDQDPSAEDMSLAGEAASAVQSWQQQASGSAAGSAATSPRQQAVPAAGVPAAEAAQAAVEPAAAAAGPAPAAAAAAGPAPAAPPAAAPALPAALELPSDAAALPPGRERAPVAGAQIDLGSAASLVHWSQPASEQLSPESSALGSPQKSPPQPGSQQSSPQRPPLQQRRGRPPALVLPGTSLPPSGRRRSRQRSSARSSLDRPQDAQQAQQAQQQHEEEEDRFAAAFSRLSMRGIRARKRSAEPASRRGSQAALAALAGVWGEEEEAVRTPPPPSRQWHFFTGMRGGGTGSTSEV